MDSCTQMTIGEGADGKPESRQSIHSVPVYAAILFLIIGFATFGLVIVLDRWLPSQLKIADEAQYPDAFIGERSQNHLKQLTDIGPRVAGSYENEVLAVEFLKREISYIVTQADPSQQIDVDVQIVSGQYFLGKPFFLTNVYRNIQNVVVRLSAKNTPSNISLLLNAHFDSVPTSPGATDDGISCTTMLEILRILSRSSKPLRHNVIFLFNGAEETPLQASHAFIVHHKWAPEVRAVINMEGAGAGGREILFQAGPGNPWLMKYYSKVAPHPHAQVIGEELFQMNFIPSDTDFRIFRDFGNLSGVDMAFSKNGYVYHTKYDAYDIVPDGSYQHIGDNVLALVRALGNAEEMGNSESSTDGKLVFFDLIGFTIVVYGATIGIVINSLTIVLGIFVCYKGLTGIQSGMYVYNQLFLSIGAQVLGWMVGVLICCLIGVFLDAVHSSMSWYGKPWLVCGLFVIPCMVGSAFFILLLSYFHNKSKTIEMNIQAQIHSLATLIIWMIALLVLTAIGMRSAYIFMIICIFPIMAHLVIFYTKQQYSVRTWLYIYLPFLILPSIFSMYQGLELLNLFIPVSGRMGSLQNVDVMIGGMTGFSSILATSFFIPLICIVRHPGKLLIGLFSFNILTILIVAFTPLGFPYSSTPGAAAPERFSTFHTERVMHDVRGNVRKEDAGFFVLNMDRNSPSKVLQYIDIKNASNDISTECEEEIFCGVPIPSARNVKTVNASNWIPAPPPVIHEPTSLKLLSQKLIKTNVRRLTFRIIGPDHMGVFLVPKTDMKLISWNVTDETPYSITTWKDRETYFITYGRGIDRHEPWEFYLDIETPVGWTRSVLDFVLTAHYKHHEKERTAVYQKFINQFPSWAHVIGFISSYKSWVF